MDAEAVHGISSKLGISDLVPRNASVVVYSQLLDRPAILTSSFETFFYIKGVQFYWRS